jgi:hypothetical protein
MDSVQAASAGRNHSPPPAAAHESNPVASGTTNDRMIRAQRPDRHTAPRLTKLPATVSIRRGPIAGSCLPLRRQAHLTLEPLDSVYSQPLAARKSVLVSASRRSSSATLAGRKGPVPESVQ